MNGRNGFFWLCLICTILLAAGVVFLPRHFSRSLDLRDLNRVEVSRRDDFSFLEQSSDGLTDAVHAFRSIGQDKENLVLISSIEEPIQMSTELMDQVYDQVRTAFEEGMLFWISPEIDYIVNDDGTEEATISAFDNWMKYAKFARYYSLTYASDENPNKKEMLNFWYLRFSDTRNFDYYFVVNAVTYQIYYAKIYNTFTEEVASMSIFASEQRQYSTDNKYSEVVVVDRDMLTWYNRHVANGCRVYYEAGKMEFIDSQNLHDKLGVVILYYDSQAVYLEQALAEESDFVKYHGISIGLQEVANWVWMLEEQE